MLRFFCNGKAATKSMNSLTTSFMRCMSESVQQNPQSLEQRKPFRERLEVNLCGRISGSPIKIVTGLLVIPLITKNDNTEHFTKHRTLLSSPKLQDLLGDRLIDGQRIYVNGFIGYTEFQTAEGHRKHSAWIAANDVYVCEQNDDANTDVNEVRLFGRVEFQPQNGNSATFLEVSTQYFDRKEQMYKKKLHQILIRDDDNMRQRASCIDVGENVFIHGFLKTESARTADDKWRPMYYIRPTKLVVSERIEKNQPADDDEF